MMSKTTEQIDTGHPLVTATITKEFQMTPNHDVRIPVPVKETVEVNCIADLTICFELKNMPWVTNPKAHLIEYLGSALRRKKFQLVYENSNESDAEPAFKLKFIETS